MTGQMAVTTAETAPVRRNAATGVCGAGVTLCAPVGRRAQVMLIVRVVGRQGGSETRPEGTRRVVGRQGGSETRPYVVEEDDRSDGGDHGRDGARQAERRNRRVQSGD
jgi:hypothetical protein